MFIIIIPPHDYGTPPCLPRGGQAGACHDDFPQHLVSRMVLKWRPVSITRKYGGQIGEIYLILLYNQTIKVFFVSFFSVFTLIV